MKCEIIGVMLIVGATQTVIVGRARNKYDIRAVKMQVGVLESVLIHLRVIKYDIVNLPIA